MVIKDVMAMANTAAVKAASAQRTRGENSSITGRPAGPIRSRRVERAVFGTASRTTAPRCAECAIFIEAGRSYLGTATAAALVIRLRSSAASAVWKSGHTDQDGSSEEEPSAHCHERRERVP